MKGFSFPEDRPGAVTFTYDDAMHQHLDVAMPQLESAGLRGTFYCTTGSPDSIVNARPDELARAIRRAGHELGNHSVHHPCYASLRYQPSTRLDDYDQERMHAELLLAERRLNEIDTSPRTYAYPCGHSVLGPSRQSYVPLVRSLFAGARGGGRGLADPADVDLYRLPCKLAHAPFTFEQARDFLDQAVSERKWATLAFHGVGGGHISADADVHQRICDYARTLHRTLYCGTVIDIVTLIRQGRGEPWTPGSQ